MRDQRHILAGGGLRLMFIGGLIALCVFLPIVGAFAALGGGIVSLIGLVQTQKADADYKNAVTMFILGLVIGVVQSLVEQFAPKTDLGVVIGVGGIVIAVLSILDVLVSFLQVYYVCKATSGLLREMEETRVAAFGDVVWKLYAACAIASVVIGVIAGVVLLAGAVLSALSFVLSIISSVFYFIFLFRSQKAMLA